MNEESNNDSKNSVNLKRFLKDKEPKKPEFVVAIIVNIILFYVVNNLFSWNISFITASFNDVLWIFNISIIANILANIIYLVYYSDWLRSIIQVILNILGFLVVYYLYVVFPFVFNSSWITNGLKFVLIVGMIALVIATFVEVLKFILKYVVKVEGK